MFLKVALIATTVLLGASALGYAVKGSADGPGSGVIVGRVFEPGAPNYKQTQLTVLPNNGADAYGVFVTAECFDILANGDPWPSVAAICR